MLFSSFVFVFAFLPVALGGYYLAARFGRALAAAWLVAASLVFYGWWDPRFVLLLIASILYNYGVTQLIVRMEGRERLQSAILTLGVAGDLAALCYYKYLFAIFEFLRLHHVADIPFAHVVLPLGISFFTFTQIGFLVDVRQGVTKDRSFLNYLLFVTFFPHLIAGPILHNREMMPQYADAKTYRFSSQNLAVGLTIFIIGLAKKCLLADPLSAIVGTGFSHPGSLTAIAAWDTALCYSLQLYFDFSGYSDMAIGLARMFNVRFPLNFNSPFKARNVIDYWQRWHMTLTRFITLYIYNPMALTIVRRRAARGQDVSRAAQSSLSGMAMMVARPTIITMALAGIWHGAGLQFLVFGLLHGCYITINHAMRILRGGAVSREKDSLWAAVWKTLLTYCAVLVGFIFFRAASAGDAVDLLGSMTGMHGGPGQLPALAHLAWVFCLYVTVWGMPNTQQIMIDYAPALGKILPGPLPWLRWRETLWWSAAAACAASLAVMGMGGSTEFIYFQF
jgi:D-alanyl-lipoteichoic acid acyltransferase DltB (MBOAT superfamily)